MKLTAVLALFCGPLELPSSTTGHSLIIREVHICQCVDEGTIYTIKTMNIATPIKIPDITFHSPWTTVLEKLVPALGTQNNLLVLDINNFIIASFYVVNMQGCFVNLTQ